MWPLNHFPLPHKYKFELNFIFEDANVFNKSICFISIKMHIVCVCLCRKIRMYVVTSLSDYCLFIVLLVFNGAFAWQWESSLISKQQKHIEMRTTVFTESMVRSGSVILLTRLNCWKEAEKGSCISRTALIALLRKATIMFTFQKNACHTTYRLWCYLIVWWSDSKLHSRDVFCLILLQLPQAIEEPKVTTVLFFPMSCNVLCVCECIFPSFLQCMPLWLFTK